MEEERPDGDQESRHKLDALSAQVATNHAEIEALQARADKANHRASTTEETTDEHGRRIDRLEARAEVDRLMIAELRAEGILSHERVEHLEEALRSSRVIGVAMGIIMANRKVSEEVAFEMLKRASQQANRKIRVLADQILQTGDVSLVPEA